MQVHRPIIMSRRGIVVAGHHLAAEAGAQVLREGGNAMDAAVAAAATLAVAIPHMNGVGGDCFALWLDARTSEATAVNGSGGAPDAATVERYGRLGHSRVPYRGPLSVSVPGAVHAWATALEKFGTIPLARALRPAADLAAEGLPVDRSLAAFLAGETYAALVAAAADLAAVYGPPGPRTLGQTVRMPALAASLRAIAADGPGAFYGGPVGAALVRDLARAGGIMVMADLAEHATLLQKPLSVAYRGWQVLANPPNTQGIALLAILGLLEAEDRLGIDPDEPFLSRFMRVKQTAFMLRDRHLGDPGLVDLPGDILVPERLSELARAGRARAPAAGSAPAAGDTSCIVAMDAEGNAASLVQSLFEEFGSGVLSPATGIVLHNRLSLASMEPGGPNTLGPRRRPFHTLCPALALEGNECRLAIATPGDHGQPQTLAQVIDALRRRGLDIQEAVEAPRIRHDSGREIMHESRIDAAALAPLAGSGFTLADLGAWARPMGGVNAIFRPAGGPMMGAGDPRRASYAVAA